ncbi:MAG: hypothetical protein AAF264_07800 [Pseudomonadota bacterium]
MFANLKQFAFDVGTARRSARSNFAVEFARPTIEQRILRAVRTVR